MAFGLSLSDYTFIGNLVIQNGISESSATKIKVNTNKIRIKSTPLFKQVAAVIGEERAQIELAIVYHAIPVQFNAKLNVAFYWLDSPQKGGFWRDINKGINPCKN